MSPSQGTSLSLAPVAWARRVEPQTIPHSARVRERESLFTVASTVCEILAEKPRNSAQRYANQLVLWPALKNTLRNVLKNCAKTSL